MQHLFPAAKFGIKRNRCFVFFIGVGLHINHPGIPFGGNTLQLPDERCGYAPAPPGSAGSSGLTCLMLVMTQPRKPLRQYIPACCQRSRRRAPGAGQTRIHRHVLCSCVPTQAETQVRHPVLPGS